MRLQPPTPQSGVKQSTTWATTLLSGPVRVQIVYKDYQQKTPVGKELIILKNVSNMI